MAALPDLYWIIDSGDTMLRVSQEFANLVSLHIADGTERLVEGKDLSGSTVRVVLAHVKIIHDSSKEVRTFQRAMQHELEEEAIAQLGEPDDDEKDDYLK